MRDSHTAQARCAEMITTLGREWDLSPEQEAAYARAIVAYLPEHYTDAQLQRLALCYHLDHQEVHILRDPQYPGHQEAWRDWHGQVIRILRNANLDWLTDIAIDFEDLTQIALEVLSKSIASYRFNSRFSTWAFTVIVRAGKRAIRERRAIKRTGTVVSLDDPTAIARHADSLADPEARARARELNELIDTILAEQGGSRWVEIFRLWIHEDQRLVDIGQRFDLSSSRVSILLDHMRKLLRQHPALLEWRQSVESGTEPPGDADKESDSRNESEESGR